MSTSPHAPRTNPGRVLAIACIAGYASHMTTTDQLRTDDDLSIADYALADLLEVALEAANADGLTPSVAARKVRSDRDTTARVLAWMVANQYAHSTGNGAWRHYHAGRGQS